MIHSETQAHRTKTNDSDSREQHYNSNIIFYTASNSRPSRGVRYPVQAVMSVMAWRNAFSNLNNSIICSPTILDQKHYHNHIQFKNTILQLKGIEINPDCSSTALPVISQCDSGVCSKPSLILKFFPALALSHLPTVIDLKMLLTTSSLRYSFTIYEHLINKQWSIHTANGNQKTAGN